MMEFYYNIYSKETDALLGTVEVPYVHDSEIGPAKRARQVAVAILSPSAVEDDPYGDRYGGAPQGITAVQSTREMFNIYGLNK